MTQTKTGVARTIHGNSTGKHIKFAKNLGGNDCVLQR